MGARGQDQVSKESMEFVGKEQSLLTGMCFEKFLALSTTSCVIGMCEIPPTTTSEARIWLLLACCWLAELPGVLGQGVKEVKKGEDSLTGVLEVGWGSRGSPADWPGSAELPHVSGSHT